MKLPSSEHFFLDGYHGGVSVMRRWGKKGYCAAPIWDFNGTVQDWFNSGLFRRLDQFPTYKAALEVDSATFEYWEEHDPELLREIVVRIHKEKIEVTDGTYAQPFGHTVGQESIVRHFLYGQESLERITGRKSKTFFKQEHMFLPNLPGLLQNAGYESVILRAHINHFGQCPKIDKEFIRWRGSDQSEIVAIPNYFQDCYPYGFTSETLDAFETVAQKAGILRALFTQGLDICHDSDFIDDFVKHVWQRNGDSAQSKELRHDAFMLSSWPAIGMSDAKLTSLMNRGYKSVLPMDFFEGVSSHGEPLHLSASYFNYKYLWGAFGDRLLKAIRRAEGSLYSAEAIVALLGLVGCKGYESKNLKLERNWKQLLDAESHDYHICPGSYSLAVADFPVNIGTNLAISVADEADEIASHGITDLIRCVSQPGPHLRLVLFNTLSFRRRELLEVSIELPQGGYKAGLSLRCGSTEIPYDCLEVCRFPDGSISRADLVLSADVPGLGFQTISIHPSHDLSLMQRTEDRDVDTGCVRAIVGNGGILEHLGFSQNSQNLLKSSPFGANELTADFRSGLVRTAESIGESICLRGRLLTQFSAVGKLGPKSVNTCIRFWQGSAEIDFTTDIDFGMDASTTQSDPITGTSEYSGAVRVNFSPTFGGDFFSELPLSVERWDHEKIVPGLRFACLTNREVGLTLMSKGNLGYYRNPDQGVSLSLILAAGDSDYRYGPYPLSETMRFNYRTLLHHGDWVDAHAVLRSAAYHTPILASMLWGEPSAMPLEGFLSLSEPRVIATTLHQRNGAIWLRLWNSMPQEVMTDMKMFRSNPSVVVTDLFGGNPTPIERVSNCYPLRFAPFETKTLILQS